MNTWDLGSKSKKQKKRKGGGKNKLNGDFGKTVDVKVDEEDENDEIEVGETDPKTPSEHEAPIRITKLNNVNSSTNGSLIASGDLIPHEAASETSEEMHGAGNNDVDTTQRAEAVTLDQTPQSNGSTSLNGDTEAKLDALARERSALREEVAQLRRSLEEIQEKHDEDLTSVREQLEATQGEKTHAETQYRNLLGKVNTIRSQLGDRLKADAVRFRLHSAMLTTKLTSGQEDLSQARTRIEDLEEQCRSLKEQNDTRAAELATMAEEAEQRSKELSSLRNRTTLSQQNWSKEREDLVHREILAKEDFEAAKQAMQDWEVLAMEERSIRANITERVADLEEQLLSQREAHEKAAAERDTQSLTVDGLQRALQEIQDGWCHVRFVLL